MLRALLVSCGGCLCSVFVVVLVLGIVYGCLFVIWFDCCLGFTLLVV